MFSPNKLSEALLYDKNKTFLMTRNIFNKDFIVDKNIWSEIKSCQFDTDVITKMNNLRCVKYTSKLLDLGSIDEFIKKSTITKKISPINKTYNSKNINFWNNSTSNIIVSNLNDIDIIFNDENLLISNSRKRHDKKIFQKIDKLNIRDQYKFVFKSWGWYRTLSISDTFHIKEICVKPGERLSLQSHKKRKESWLVINGIATVIREKTTYLLNANESIQIDVDQKHQLINNEKKDLTIIEIQTGTYFGEDDITRYLDK